jgi:hypothetical protein
VLGHRSSRGQRIPALLAHALANDVDLLAQLKRLFIEQQVEVAEVAALHVPVEVLGLDVEREVIGKQAVQLVDQGGFGIVVGVGHDNLR